ncbi:MAG: cytochrome c class I [Bacteroidetes bacterium HGW-Bacteroidetes-18]|nr:MAG: cytochrome c class I [Bacteroidetes bacterium HGW-Bacteroidetes-18]
MRNFFLAGIIIFGLFGFAKYNALQQDKWVAPSTAKNIINPVSEKKKSASVKNGAKIFAQFCVACHGTGGKGDGIGGKSLNPKPANLTSDPVQKQVDGEIFWKISNGRNSMIKWEPIIPEKDRWDLVNYLRTIKR